MGINFGVFALTCAALYAITVFLAWWAYENDKLAPGFILLLCMGVTAFVTACLMYVTMIVFGG